MPIEVTARHMHVNVDVQDYARRKASELVDEFSRIEHIHVILDHQKRQNVAEIVVQAKNRIRLEASESSENMRVAIDVAADKAEKQLRRLRDKVQDHRVKSLPQKEVVGQEEEPEVEND